MIKNEYKSMFFPLFMPFFGSGDECDECDKEVEVKKRTKDGDWLCEECFSKYLKGLESEIKKHEI